MARLLEYRLSSVEEVQKAGLSSAEEVQKASALQSTDNQVRIVSKETGTSPC